MIIKHDFIFIVLVRENNRDDAHNNKYNKYVCQTDLLKLESSQIIWKITSILQNITNELNYNLTKLQG